MTLKDPTQPPDVIGCTIALVIAIGVLLIGLLIGIAL